MKKAVFIIAKASFRDEEYFEPKAVLERGGVAVTTASSSPGPCAGKLGAKAIADVGIPEIDPSAYDAIIVAGGPGAYEYFHDKEVHKVITAMFEAGKIVAGICAGAAILAYSGVLKDKKATSFSGVSKDLEACDAVYTGKAVEIDGKIITADGPSSASRFGSMIVKALNNG
jgi:protease I